MPGGFDIPVRYFVEVKRWRDRIGVEVFDQVYGAMILERERYGWHGALIVALGGISNTRKFSREEYRKKGLEVRDKKDLIRWLDDYKPKANGLWVPAHFTGRVEKKTLAGPSALLGHGYVHPTVELGRAEAVAAASDQSDEGSGR